MKKLEKLKKALKGWTVESDGTLIRPTGLPVPKDNPLSNGYLQVSVSYKGERYMLKQHRVAHYLRTGNWPEMVDHINGIPSDNSEGNLRCSDNMRNQRNQYRHRDGSCGITERTINGKVYYRVRVRTDQGQIERSTTDATKAETILQDLRKRYGYEEIKA